MMRQAVVLVGGKGTRLGALAKDSPKPLLPISGDKRFLDFLLENLARHGVREIILLAGHMGELVAQRYDGARVWDAQVSVIIEPSPAGTGGALRYALDRLDDTFFMSNGDSFLDMNYLALGQALKPSFEGALALRQVSDVRRYAHVTLADGVITGFREKDEAAQGSGLISGGVYALRRSVLDRIAQVPASIETEVFPGLAAQGKLAGLAVDGYFLDIGLPETLAQARAETADVLRRPIVFFDRDGTLTKDDGYTHRPEDLALLPGAAEAVRAVNDAGALAVVVTNQSGIARGLYTTAQMDGFHAALQAELAKTGAHIDAFYAAPFHEDGAVARYTHADHPDRKPNPGLLRRAALAFDAEHEGSGLVGDAAHDAAAAEALGLPGVVVAPSGLLGAVESLLAARRPAPGRLAGAVALIHDRAAQAERFLFDHALPLWWEKGFDRASGCFHERLDAQGEPVALPRRVRVQARQTFVYALAGELGWSGPWREATEAGARVLLSQGLRPDGGTRFSLDETGAPKESRRDLYDVAFVIFALASAAKALKTPSHAAAARGLLDWTLTHWSHPEGGFTEGEIVTVPPRRQNPHMHILEALLQLFEATGDADLLTHAGALVRLLETRWVEPEFGALLEYFDDAWRPVAGEDGRIAEPGHQFEWAWLLDRYAKLSGTAVSPVARRIYEHGEVYGVTLAGGVTVDETFLEGGVRTPTSRFWPHTERIKANIVRFERDRSIRAAHNAAQAFDVLMRYCERPTRGVWYDRLLPDGSFVEEAAPASSFYHAALAMGELIRVARTL